MVKLNAGMTERTYRIGEVARLLDLEGYVLRFWETEFSQLSPGRTPKGQRFYTEADIALLRRIRDLLHVQGMTIEGARRILAGEHSSPFHTENDAPGTPPASAAYREVLLQVERELILVQQRLRHFR